MAARRGLTATIALVVCFAVESAAAQQWRSRRPEPEATEEEPPAPEEARDAEEEEPGDETLDGDGQATEGAEVDPALTAPVDAPAEPEEARPTESYAFGPDLSPIRSQFTAIMDELVQLRSRTAVLGRQLFNTRVSVTVENRASDDNVLERMVLHLDGAPIFQASSGEVEGDGREAFDGFAAPGPHVLSVEAEQRQRADQSFRYTMRDAYRFQVVRDRLTEITIILEDDSNIGEDFEDDGEGLFDVRTRFRVATREIGEE